MESIRLQNDILKNNKEQMNFQEFTTFTYVHIFHILGSAGRAEPFKFDEFLKILFFMCFSKLTLKVKFWGPLELWSRARRVGAIMLKKEDC